MSLIDPANAAITLPLDLIRRVVKVAHNAAIEKPSLVGVENIQAIREVSREVDQVEAMLKLKEADHVSPDPEAKKHRNLFR